jgi:hypothetical protein
MSEKRLRQIIALAVVPMVSGFFPARKRVCEAISSDFPAPFRYGTQEGISTMSISAISNSNPVAPASPVAPVRSVTRFTPRTAGAEVTREFAGAAAVRTESRSGSLQLRTKDGDTISLSFSAASESKAAVASNGATTLGEFSKSSSAELKLEVNGSLDKKELSDIMRLLKKLGNFLRGGADPDKAAKLTPKASSSIAGFEFNYQESRSLETASLSVLA